MNADKLAQLRELFETWLASRPSFRTTVEVQAAWEGWKANTAVAAMLAELDAQPAPAAQPVGMPDVPTIEMFEAFRDWEPGRGKDYAGAQSVTAYEWWAFRKRYAAMLARKPQYAPLNER